MAPRGSGVTPRNFHNHVRSGNWSLTSTLPTVKLTRCAPERGSHPRSVVNLLQTSDLALLALGLLADELGVVRGGKGVDLSLRSFAALAFCESVTK